MLNIAELRKDFKSKDEEIEFLRSLIMDAQDKQDKTKSFNLIVSEKKESKESQIDSLLKKYKAIEPTNVLDKNFVLEEEHVSILSLGLSPEEHDDKLQKLIDIFLTEGIRNTFSVLEKMDDSHLEDDFHRFLVQYILKVSPENLQKKLGNLKETVKAVETTLFQIVLPTEKDNSVNPQNAQPDRKTLSP